MFYPNIGSNHSKYKEAEQKGQDFEKDVKQYLSSQ